MRSGHVEVARFEEELLAVAVTTNSRVARLTLDGELDMSTEELVSRASGIVLQLNPSAVHVDLVQLSFCDARGVSALLAMRASLVSAGVPVHCENAQRVVRLAFATVGLASLLQPPPPVPVHPSAESAIITRAEGTR